jgi:hypothetical protein
VCRQGGQVQTVVQLCSVGALFGRGSVTRYSLATCCLCPPSSFVCPASSFVCPASFSASVSACLQFSSGLRVLCRAWQRQASAVRCVGRAGRSRRLYNSAQLVRSSAGAALPATVLLLAVCVLLPLLCVLLPVSFVRLLSLRQFQLAFSFLRV